MVADLNGQKAPLVIKIEMEEVNANQVRQYLERDDNAGIQQLLQQGNAAAVLRPKHSSSSADTSTSLHLATKLGAEKSLRVLLNPRPTKEDLEAPNNEGQTALLTAVAEIQSGPFQQLLHAGANINARDNMRRSVLHLLVLKLSKKLTEEEQRRLLDIASLLLSPPYLNGLDLEPHANLAGLIHATPLAAAAAKLKLDDSASWAAGLLELCKKLVKVGASISEDVDGATVEQVLTQKNCLTPALLNERKQPPLRPTASQVVDMIIMGGSSDELKKVLKEKPDIEASEAVNSNLGSESLLFHAVNKMNISEVEVLMDYGANPWRVVTGELPLHRAAAKGHVAIFTKLLEKMKGSNKTLNLQEHSTSLINKLMENYNTKVTLQERNHMACLRLLLQEDIELDLNQKYHGQTALHIAAAFNNQEAMSEMLQAGAYLGARQMMMGRDYGTILNNVLPGTLLDAMDGCIKYYCDDRSNKIENIVNEDYTLHLDYRFLLPPQEKNTNTDPIPVNEMETLMDLCRSRKHRNTIKHPLAQALLFAKWRKALPFYLMNMVFYLIFVLVLTLFVYFLKDQRIIEAQLAALHQNGTTDASLETSLSSQTISVLILKVVLLLAWFFILVREGFQIKHSKEFYFKSIENYLEWFLIVIVLLLCFAPLAVDPTRHLAAWAMIVAWYEFVLVLGHAPPLALYITMLRQVSWNFLKLIFLFSALILAFTISFNIILQPSGGNQGGDFNNFWTTLPKAIVMSTGEFEYSDLSEKFPKTMLMASSVMVFLVFLFVIFLVLMNVMNGLAVTDAQEIVEDAKLYSLTSRIELIYLVETFFLRCPFIRSYRPNIRLLTGHGNSPSLLVRINHPKKSERLLSGSTYNITHKLDTDTTECLRDHRQQYLEEEKKKHREENAAQLQVAVQELAEHHPDIMRSLAAALRPAQ